MVANCRKLLTFVTRLKMIKQIWWVWYIYILFFKLPIFGSVWLDSKSEFWHYIFRLWSGCTSWCWGETLLYSVSTVKVLLTPPPTVNFLQKTVFQLDFTVFPPYFSISDARLTLKLKTPEQMNVRRFAWIVKFKYDYANETANTHPLTTQAFSVSLFLCLSVWLYLTVFHSISLKHGFLQKIHCAPPKPLLLGLAKKQQYLKNGG